MAMQEAGMEECNLAILYATSKQDPVLLSEGVRSVIGSGARVIGGFTLGIITKDFLAYGSCIPIRHTGIFQWKQQ